VTTSASSTRAIRIPTRGILASATIDGPYREPRLCRCHPMSPRRLAAGLRRACTAPIATRCIAPPYGRSATTHDAEDVTLTAFLDAYRAICALQADLPRAWLLAMRENVRRRRFQHDTWEAARGASSGRDAAVGRAAVARADRGDPAALRGWPRTSGRCSCCASWAGSRTARSRSQLDLSVPAVQMLLFRARQKLRAELDQSRSVRLGGLIPVPHWLFGLADRFPAGFAVPRVAGLRRGRGHRHERRRRFGRIGCRAEAATGRACATRSLEAGESSSRRTCSQCGPHACARQGGRHCRFDKARTSKR
jgi:DNA-directed RNA polymerase specialized sigma24 family protein